MSFLQASPQREEAFKARLAPVPIDATMKDSVTGTGSVRAILSGTKLTITGSFEGLQGPATVARLHLGRVTGVRGSPIHDVIVEKNTRGNIRADIDLTAEQAEALRKGRIYLQLHSEKAPEGNLWGWLLR